MRRILIGLAAISSSCFAQDMNIENYEIQYNAQMKQCQSWYNVAVQNGCVGNRYVHSDQGRLDQCMRNALQQRTGCEQRANSAYQARVRNLNRYNSLSDGIRNQNQSQNR